MSFTGRPEILIASDSFKDNLTSLEVAQAIEQGIRRVYPECTILKIPIADGGEGTVEAVLAAAGGTRHYSQVLGPRGKERNALWGETNGTAVIEMAEASGLALLEEKERNCLYTSTFGTGQLIREALDTGLKRILIGIGGSATNDGGAGMARALGVRFLDHNGHELDGTGESLARIAAIDTDSLHPLIKGTEILVACDVNNPLLGSEGAVEVYSRQKGADRHGRKLLEKGLANLAEVFQTTFPDRPDYKLTPGAGAAGGLGFGLLAFCGASMASGIDTILDTMNMDQMIKGKNLLITGEGRMDGQSVFGKAPVGLAKRAARAGVPVIAIVGQTGKGYQAVHDHGINAVFSCVDRVASLEDVLTDSVTFLADRAEQIMRLVQLEI